MSSPDMAPAFVARALKRRCGGAQVRKDTEGIVDTMSRRLEGVRPATASDSAVAAEGWRHMRARAQGFTLVEVMVALIIAALLLPALLMSFANQADGIGYLRDKSVAQWVAGNELTRVRIDWYATQLIFQGQREGQSSMAGRDWYWWVSSSETDVEDFYRIDVRVALAETESEQPLYTLTGFLSAPAEPLASLPEDSLEDPVEETLEISPEEPPELTPEEQRDGG